MMVKVKIGKAGYCEAGGHHAERGAKRETIQFNALFALITHPVHGYILFDTGYTDRFFEGTSKFPYQIYAQATKVFLNKEDEVKNQLVLNGISSEEIKYIIISHFHADHIGGLKDFSNAKFITTKKAYLDVKGRNGFGGLKRAFIPSLMPLDFEKRALFIDIENSTQVHPELGPVYDLFGDQSIIICALDGHAKGMMGALIKTKEREICLISDAAWLKSNYQSLRLPHPIVKLFFDSWSDFKKSLKKVNELYINNPQILIVPSHCKETFSELPQDIKF